MIKTNYKETIKFFNDIKGEPLVKYFDFEHSIRVADICEQYKNEILDINNYDNIHIACLLHDTIEDGVFSYSGIANNYNETIAELVYAVTNELGKSRLDIAYKTYPKIVKNPDAIFIKLCDRIDNMRRSVVDLKKGNDAYFAMYIKEYALFKACFCNIDKYQSMWNELDKLNKGEI